MTQVRGAFQQLMTPGLRKIYDDATQYEQVEKQYPMLFNVETSSSEYEQDLEMALLATIFFSAPLFIRICLASSNLSASSKAVLHIHY